MRVWADSYEELDDLHRKYRLLRREMASLRAEAHDREGGELFDPDAVAAALRDPNDTLDGALIAFVANDFGRPMAFRPERIDREVQAEVRRAILRGKYDSHEDLNEIRRNLLDAFPAVHKAIVAEYDDPGVRYHLPEGTSRTTNFLTVREMVGLVDYTTNSSQREDLSRTY